MIAKTIKYVDYNGVERNETFYFNLSKAEATEFELGVTGGLSEMLKKMVMAKDTPALIKLLKQLLLKTYGVKSDDGRRFIKSEELSREFSQTEAYSQMYMELATDDNAAAAFIKGVVSGWANSDEIDKALEEANK